MTDEGGRYAIKTKAGRLQLKVRAHGYEPCSAICELSPGRVDSLVVQLQRTPRDTFDLGPWEPDTVFRRSLPPDRNENLIFDIYERPRDAWRLRVWPIAPDGRIRRSPKRADGPTLFVRRLFGGRTFAINVINLDEQEFTVDTVRVEVIQVRTGTITALDFDRDLRYAVRSRWSAGAADRGLYVIRASLDADTLYAAVRR